MIDEDGSKSQVNFLIMEVAEGGELFDWIAHGGKFEEDLARYYFSECIKGIKAVHDAGYAHRDLKAENILVTHEYVVKICDFGLAGLLEGRDGQGVMRSKKGTEGYRAPEIMKRNAKYDG